MPCCKISVPIWYFVDAIASPAFFSRGGVVRLPTFQWSGVAGGPRAQPARRVALRRRKLYGDLRAISWAYGRRKFVGLTVARLLHSVVLFAGQGLPENRMRDRNIRRESYLAV